MITREDFKIEVGEIAKELDVTPKSIQFRTMTRKLASCSINGRLTFDLSLLSKPKDIRREIIIHELLHLRYPTHGRMFKTTLKAYKAKD